MGKTSGAVEIQVTGIRAQGDVPVAARAAVQLALNLLSPYPADAITLIGSSLGGFYANWIAEKIGCKAVLLNPAIAPQQSLAQQIGVTTAYHSDQAFEFKPEYIDQLKALGVPRITLPARYFLIAATGDEVLDWRDMTAHFAGARQCVIQGSDHGLSEFGAYADQVLEFCGIRTGSGA